MSVYVLIRHEVEDYDAWKDGFDSAKAMRQAGGETSAQVFRDADNPNLVTVLNGWDSFERAEEFLQNPDLADAMERSGVISEPEVIFMTEA
jgi:quinol monooxygenase YgiN